MCLLVCLQNDPSDLQRRASCRSVTTLITHFLLLAFLQQSLVRHSLLPHNRQSETRDKRGLANTYPLCVITKRLCRQNKASYCLTTSKLLRNSALFLSLSCISDKNIAITDVSPSLSKYVLISCYTSFLYNKEDISLHFSAQGLRSLEL